MSAWTVDADPLLALPAVLPDDLESVRVLVEAGLPCCERNDVHGDNLHEDDCENFDGAPIHQWEVTTPPDVYLTDDDASWGAA